MTELALASPASTCVQPGRWTEVCGNDACNSGWLHLWRRRRRPLFEDKWACSPACMEQVVARTVRSEIDGWDVGTPSRSLRMPLGLILLSRGWIGVRELQGALAAQRESRQGRLGEWLCRLYGIPEQTIAKGLAAQWSCAVLSRRCTELRRAADAMPLFLQQHYDLLPLQGALDGTIYLAGRVRAEHAAVRALERMTDAPVVAAFVEDQAWGLIPPGGANQPLPPGSDGVVASVRDMVERARPQNARLVRIHDHLWLRMWMAREQVSDAIFELRSSRDMDSRLQGPA